MKIFYVLFSPLIFSGNYAFVQEITFPANKPTALSTNSGTPEIVNEIPKEGTYQIIFKNGTPQFTLGDEILFQVNHLRAYENVVIIYVDVNTQINIIPYKLIYDPNFVPLPTYVFE